MNTEIIKQYEEAIVKALSPKQVEFLQLLYYCPDSSATAKEIARILNYSGWQPVNRQTGAIGKKMADYVKIDLPKYNDKGRMRFAYFILIGEYNKDTGWVMWPELQAALEKLGLVARGDDAYKNNERLPTEIPVYEEEQLFREGRIIKIYVNRYERNLNARLKCINHFGVNCYVCGFDFEKVYGEMASGFIHVHHKKPIGEIGKEYEVDPINDLVPLCPNCHSVIHLSKPALTVEELKSVLKQN
jgi:predicted HNH restriction endonuclease